MGAEDRGEAAAGVIVCLCLAEPVIALTPVSSPREPLHGFCTAWFPDGKLVSHRNPGWLRPHSPSSGCSGDP